VETSFGDVGLLRMLDNNQRCRSSTLGCPPPATRRRLAEDQLERQDLLHVCFGVHCGVKSDIARGPWTHEVLSDMDYLF
jgi:hypothetical protein